MFCPIDQPDICNAFSLYLAATEVATWLAKMPRSDGENWKRRHVVRASQVFMLIQIRLGIGNHKVLLMRLGKVRKVKKDSL